MSNMTISRYEHSRLVAIANAARLWLESWQPTNAEERSLARAVTAHFGVEAPPMLPTWTASGAGYVAEPNPEMRLVVTPDVCGQGWFARVLVLGNCRHRSWKLTLEEAQADAVQWAERKARKVLARQQVEGATAQEVTT